MNPKKRSAGVLMPIASLPNHQMIGDFGPAAYDFIDFLSEARQTRWQILPLNPFARDGSPYFSTCSFAVEPMFISPILMNRDLHIKDPFKFLEPERECAFIDYHSTRLLKSRYLDAAFLSWYKMGGQLDSAFLRFQQKQAAWLYDFSLFSCLSSYYSYADWSDWPDQVDRECKYHDTNPQFSRFRLGMLKHMFFQFVAHTQWMNIKSYANKKSIRIIGDAPMYMAPSSMDVWANQSRFQLDRVTRKPHLVAGVPPDNFSRDGQVWGFALYDWNQMAADGFRWWNRRISRYQELYDIIRLDHFIGYVRYWPVSIQKQVGHCGHWKLARGKELLASLFSRHQGLAVIVEDLGAVGEDTEKLREHFCLAGMKVLQFGFGNQACLEHRPHFFSSNSVVCTGTHDHMPIQAWYEHELSLSQKDELCDYLSCKDAQSIHWALIRAAYSSVADSVIIPLGDLLALGAYARINTPGSLLGNWQWRLRDSSYKSCAKELAHLVRLYDR